jgi:hypothetical protein
VDKRKYEDKRDRCFQEHWLEKIPWLQHDERSMRCTICCNFYDNSKQQGSGTKNLFLTETEVTVVDENKVEGSDKENVQEEQTEPVNVIEQTDEEDSESEMRSSECEMSEEETVRSINKIIEYEIEYVTV